MGSRWIKSALNQLSPVGKSTPGFSPLQDGSCQAQSNLTFLSILKEPYQELAFMRPKDISNKLPKLISLIRIIWVNSPHYNTRERLTSLFRKVCVFRVPEEAGIPLTEDLRCRDSKDHPSGQEPKAYACVINVSDALRVGDWAGQFASIWKQPRWEEEL